MAILVQSNKKPSVTFPSQTGSIVTFNSQYAGLPLKSCKVDIPITQEGTGDPSPENVRNFVGVSAINISHSNRNLLPYTFEDIISANGGQSTWTDNQKIINGLTFTLNTDSNGKLTNIAINGTATYNTAFYLHSRFTSIYFPASILYSGVSANVAGYSARISHSGGQIISSTSVAVAKKNYSNCDIILFFNSGNTFDITVSPRLILSGESDSSYIPHEGIYKYIEFGQTIYAGELDVLKGIYTNENKYRITTYDSSSYWAWNSTLKGFRKTFSNLNMDANDEQLQSNWLPKGFTATETKACVYFHGQYVDFVNLDLLGITDATSWKTYLDNMGGIQISLPVETPEVINLGGMNIETTRGENNLFASTGETTAQYIKIGG